MHGSLGAAQQLPFSNLAGEQNPRGVPGDELCGRHFECEQASSKLSHRFDMLPPFVAHCSRGPGLVWMVARVSRPLIRFGLYGCRARKVGL